MACDVTTTIDDACTSGIGKVTDPVKLLQIIAQLQCEIAQNPTPPVVDGKSYLMTFAGGWESGNINASATYYIGGDLYNSTRATSTTYDNWKVRIPRSGTIASVNYMVRMTTPNASALTATHSIRLNDATDVASVAFAYNVAVNRGNADSVGQAVVAGDFIAMKIATPAWAAPAGARWYCTVLIDT